MPICDGIELMRLLAKHGFAGKIIVVSGFDDYAFVRQALKLGADDYILKPVDVAEFTALLKTCLKQVDAVGMIAPAGYTQTEDIERSMLIMQYKLKNFLENTEDTLKDISFSRADKLFVALASSFWQRRSIPDGEMQMLFRTVLNLAQKHLSACQLLQSEYGTRWVIALWGDKASLERGRKAFLSDLQGMGYHCGGSSVNHPLSEASLAYKEAAKELEWHFYNLPPLCEPDQEFPFSQCQDEIIAAICARKLKESGELFLRLFGLLCYGKPPLDQMRHMLANLIYDIMERDNSYIGVISRCKFTENDVIYIIQESDSASAMRNGIIKAISVYIEQLESSLDDPEPQEDYTVGRVKKIIEGTYRTEITLTAISQKLQMHPNYLSTLFKQKTGITYGQYLRHVRISKACELLKNTNLKTYSVALQVGYKDNAHFGRAFKDETGQTPAQYKKSHGSGKLF
jgi:two-component system response regulator YesN